MTNAALPVGWKKTTLDDVAEVQTGIAKGKAINGTSATLPYLRVANVQDGYVDLSVVKEITLKPSEVKRYSLRKGDVLFTEGGDFDKLGRGTVWNGQIEPCLHQNHVFAVRPNPKRLLPEFLALQAASHYGRRYFQMSSKQSTNLASINSTQLKQFPVLLPPLPEQRKIAEILRAWDEAIEKLEVLRGVKLGRRRALTNALVFGTRRLEHFRTTDGANRYRWFTLPASWSSKPIGALAREVSERNGDGEEHDVLSCSKYDGFVRSLEYFKKQVFSSDLTGYKKIWRGDFGFPSNHVEEGSIGLQNLTDIGIVSPIYTVFRFDPKRVDANYAFAVLKTELYRHIFEVSTSASVDRRGSLRWSEFSKLPFPVPPLAEQKTIAQVLQTLSVDLGALDTEIECLTRQKRGLMQKLLTGQWRVAV
ncbi:restriction endonuclease subunit S (plasmid) [Tistrella mobilis]|uniref:restriction endonuclease subunit S n=1 Tax=Tistrella mobilis TaxID=171437 RepID=UPI003555F633